MGYSELNSIEECWNLMKAEMKNASPEEDVIAVANAALASISRANVRAFYRDSGIIC